MLSLFFYTYNQNNQFYAVKMHKMKTNEGMPCYYDLRIGIVMLLPYYVFCDFYLFFEQI